MPDKLPPHIRAQIEEFKRKADHNSALSKEYNNYYDRFYTKDQPTYEQWLKDNGKKRLAKGGSAELKKYILNNEGTYGARRLERAIDEIPNLEDMYNEHALKRAFTGDGQNTNLLARINPADFEKYAVGLNSRTHREPTPSLEDKKKKREVRKYDMSTDDYLKYLASIGKLSDVPYLHMYQDETGIPLIPHITGHEGRHRNRALANKGQSKNLIQIHMKGALREDFPRRDREEYINALQKQLASSHNLVYPEHRGEDDEPRRPAIKLPDIYADGGKVNDSAFIGYLSPHGKFESYPESVAKANDYHHSHTIKDLDAYDQEGGLTFVRMGGEPIISIKGTPAMDPHHPKHSPMISNLARKIIASGAHRDMPIKIEDMGFKKHEAPYQNKLIGTLHEWSMRNVPIKKADGGNVQGNQMDTPSLAQMRMKLNQRSNPDFVDNIGINEAMDMSPKMYINPDPKHNGFPAIGGVSDRNGLPVGGTDQNPNEPGQQIMPTPPAPPPQEGQQGQLGGGQPPQGMPPEGMAPQGAPPPMGNMLSMTPQGQTMGAMTPNPNGGGMAKGGKVNPKQMAAIRAKMMMHKNKKKKIVFFDKGGEVDDPKYVPTSNPKRILFSAKGHGDVQGIVVPRHMWEGSTGAGRKVEGMKDINKARAEVYGSEKRAPLTIGQVGKAHKEHLKEHFAKPMEQQIADEKEALARLRKAKHIGHGSNTLDESEKLDTVRHERDPQGRAYVGFASKGVAGHSLYTSGHGEHEEHHAINTCPGQTVGCGGGHDKHGIIDTSKGTCFAPNAESQYVNAAIRRASHEQAKHDPKMTRDWILAHTHSLRNAANTADKKNLVTLFRPNVVDETDVSSRHVIKGLNKQRKADDKPLIVANSYGKTNELHDPENGYHVTHSNVGPKTKHGASIAENISRDRQRVRSTIGATDASGRDFTNDEGDKTPPKNSYMVTDVKRNSPLSKEMERHIKHAKYWSAGRHPHELAPEEHEEGEEGHYNGKGESVPEHKSHYGHMHFEGKRYDYQRQHILHPRLVQVGKNEDGTPHMIPTDSRFKDEEFLPKNRYMTKNGKKAGAILMTTPTESTSNHLHHSSFTHHVNEGHVARAKKNNGEYEIDSPLHQVMSEGKEYVAPQPINIVRKAVGGSIRKEYDDDFNAFPERNFMAQHHLTKRLGVKEEHDLHPSLLHRAED